MKRIFSILGLLLFPLCLLAQPVFVPDRDITMVGEVAFQQPRTFTLGFSNKGDKPLEIVRIEPSCGCTTVAFNQSPIKPKSKGEIQITYDAKMLGTFYKDIAVYTNASAEPVYMAIQGVVMREVTDYSSDYPIDLGNVRLKGNHIEYDQLQHGQQSEQTIHIVNTTRTPYRPELMHLPPYLTATYEPEDIPGGKAGQIRLKIDSEQLPQMGLNQTSVYLARYMGDKVSEENEIVVSAVLLPNFSDLSEVELAQAPGLALSVDTIVFEPFGKSHKQSQKIVLTNMGQTELHIHKLQVFSTALSVTLGNSVIQPGKSAKLKVTLNNDLLKKSKTPPRILIISDDPKQAMTIVPITVAKNQNPKKKKWNIRKIIPSTKD